MTEFKIKKDQIVRLKALNDYIKKMESFSPLAEKQLFILKNDKLSIYGTANTAGSGHIEATFDVDSKNEASFGLELSKFITYLEKTKADEINVSIVKDKMTVKAKTSKIEINQALIFTTPEQTVLDEIQNNIKTKLALKEFKTPIEVKLDHKDIINDLGMMTKLQNTNQEILVSKNYIKSADNLCIVSMQINEPEEDEVEQEILIDKDIIPIFKNIDSFKVSSDKKYFYFDITQFGIQIIFVPKKYNWDYPTEKDLIDISPIATKQITLEVNTLNFFETLKEYSGVFDSSSWKYEQIFFRTPKGFKTKKEFELHFDNMDVEIRNTLPVEIKEDTDTKEDFEFLLPTQHLKLLENLLMRQPTFLMKYSSTDIHDPNGIAVILENNEVSIILAKMVP